MNDTGITGAVGNEPARAEEGALLDEAAFLRTARRKSLVRSVAVSAGVVLVIVAAVAAGLLFWQLRMQSQAQRIFRYYPWLLELTTPNVQVTNGGPDASSRFPHASDRYQVSRVLAGRPVPADEVVVEYDMWGGERTRRYPVEVTASAARRYSGSSLLPVLTFIHPAWVERHERGETPDIDVDMVPGFEAESEKSRERLRSMAPSATTELALSLDRTMTLDELRAIVPTGATLSWAAVDLWGDQGPPENPNDVQLMGVPMWFFGEIEGGSDEVDAWLLVQLRTVQRYAPGPVARRMAEATDYLRRNGVRYYGAVVVGTPAALARLADDDRVFAFTTGVVLQPGE